GKVTTGGVPFDIAGQFISPVLQCLEAELRSRFGAIDFINRRSGRLPEGQDSPHPGTRAFQCVSVFGFVMALGVLSDADMASKFENGVVPDHTDIAGIR
ncbi:hypothetical protein RA985_21550, partial [Mycobacteroides abscessus subsp. abscessus]